MTKLFLTTALAVVALTQIPAAAVAKPKPAKPMAHAADAHLLHMAIANANRPAADTARDAVRKPAAVLAMLDLKPGAKVADFIMGGGYWTRILSNAVGANGKVYAYQPAEFIQFRAAYATDQDAAVAGRANVVAQRDSLGAVKFAEPLDAIVTVQNWHDLHLKMVPPTFGASVAKTLYDALKPGGVLLVVDHQGFNTAGPFTDADSLHRGDAEATRKEITAAGFTLAATSPLYANPADDKKVLVFRSPEKGKTDQFVYKFVKPR